LEDQDVGGWLILKWILGLVGMNWIDLAEDREQWKALVNTIMNLSGSMKCWAVLEWLHNWRLLKKGSHCQLHVVSYLCFLIWNWDLQENSPLLSSEF
jgi:hypothetical protein